MGSEMCIRDSLGSTSSIFFVFWGSRWYFSTLSWGEYLLDVRQTTATPICTTRAPIRTCTSRPPPEPHTQKPILKLLCVVLVLVAMRYALWTMMAELCSSVDDFILDFFSNTAADTASEYDSYGHRRCWTAATPCPYYSCRHHAKPVGLVLPRVCCSRIRAKIASIL